MNSVTTLEQIGDISVLTLDDGKANALSTAVSKEISSQLNAAQDSSKVLVLKGREGFLSAGFDIKVMRGDDKQAQKEMVAAGVELFLQLFSYPQPVVVACTGHGMAAGAILLMSCDTRIGTEGDFKIGLNEVAIGLTVPSFLMELCRERLNPAHITQATLLSTMYKPAEAVSVGFLDEVAKTSATDEAMERAQMYAETLDSRAFKSSRRYVREPAADRIRQSLSSDIASLVG